MEKNKNRKLSALPVVDPKKFDQLVNDSNNISQSRKQTTEIAHTEKLVAEVPR